ncbi:hypothetical protein [Terriglobus roseus]|uniref:hypothetical protein n=1 Tax=Terriglobus roseus TaxID=392734 RepID=UPI0012E9C004|nr:hypothetical protein [Terriglobus roseus]
MATAESHLWTGFATVDAMETGATAGTQVCRTVVAGMPSEFAAEEFDATAVP